jgi:hypothetical protein
MKSKWEDEIYCNFKVFLIQDKFFFILLFLHVFLFHLFVFISCWIKFFLSLRS